MTYKQRDDVVRMWCVVEHREYRIGVAMLAFVLGRAPDDKLLLRYEEVYTTARLATEIPSGCVRLIKDTVGCVFFEEYAVAEEHFKEVRRRVASIPVEDD